MNGPDFDTGAASGPATADLAPGEVAAAWRTAWAARQAAAQARQSVRAQLEAWLRSDAPPGAGLDQAAAYLGLHPRTLIRRLVREGTAFQALADDWRREQTLWLLQHTDTPVADIARQLGYLHASNFSRCVRRWFGTTPRALRKTPPEPHSPRP